MHNDFEIYYDWSPEKLLEITLDDPDSFLKIRETLTRVGIASKKENVLYPSCHILHKRGRYYIVHFKELFALEGKPADITVEDVMRRNTIAKLLADWGLCSVLNAQEMQVTNLSSIKILSHKEKSTWEIRPKYKMRSDRARAQNAN